MSENDSAHEQEQSAEASADVGQDTAENAETTDGEAGQGGAAEHAAATATAAPPFDADELKQFDADDALAGSIIGKMLSLLFIYTLIAMSLVSWWTWKSLE